MILFGPGAHSHRLAGPAIAQGASAAAINAREALAALARTISLVGNCAECQP